MARPKAAPVQQGDAPAISREEMRALLRDEFRQTVLDRVRATQAAKTDAAGAAAIELYRVPAGMEFRLARIYVEADTATYAAMFKNAAGSVTLLRNGQTFDGFNLANGIPNVWTSGGGSSPRFSGGDVLAIVVVGGPLSTGITARVEGDQFPDRSNGAS